MVGNDLLEPNLAWSLLPLHRGLPCWKILTNERWRTQLPSGWLAICHVSCPVVSVCARRKWVTILCTQNVIFHCEVHVTVIWTVHYKFYLILYYINKFYFSESLPHRSIDRMYYYIILLTNNISVMIDLTVGWTPNEVRLEFT